MEPLNIGIDPENEQINATLTFGSNSFKGTIKDKIYYIDDENYINVSKLSFNTKTGKYEDVTEWWKTEGTFSVCE